MNLSRLLRLLILWVVPFFAFGMLEALLWRDAHFEQIFHEWTRLEFFVYEKVEKNGRITAMQDFVCHFHLIKAVWHGEAARPYNEAGQKAIFEHWTGKSMPTGLAFGYAPPLFILYAPLTFFSARTAFSVLVFLEIFLFLGVLMRIVVPAAQGDARHLFFLLLVVMSYDFFNTIYFGSTALWTTALGAILFSLATTADFEKWGTLSKRKSIITGVILFALLAKPNVGLVWLFFLAGAGAWNSIGIGLGLAGIASLVLTPLLGGFGWIRDYLQLTSHYYQSGVGEFFRQSLMPQANSNFLGTMVQLTSWPDSVISRVSSAIWLLIMMSSLILAWKKRITPAEYVAILIGGFLLFSPNLVHTEDVALLLLVFYRPLRGNWMLVLVAYMALLVAVNTNQLHSILSNTSWGLYPIPFAAKIILFSMLILLEVIRRKTETSGNSSACCSLCQPTIS